MEVLRNWNPLENLKISVKFPFIVFLTLNCRMIHCRIRPNTLIKGQGSDLRRSESVSRIVICVVYLNYMNAIQSDNLTVFCFIQVYLKCLKKLYLSQLRKYVNVPNLKLVYQLAKRKRKDLEPVLWIRIQGLRIRIQHLSESGSGYGTRDWCSVVDPDPELFAGSGVGSGINYFGSGSGMNLKSNFSEGKNGRVHLKIFIYLFRIKNRKLLIPRPS